jgi:hypothetical protein
MLNIDTRLLDKIKSKEIAPDELITLICIAKRVGDEKTSFPSIKLLMEETTFGRDKIYSCIKGLCDKGFLEKSQRHKNGKLTSNIYKIKTGLLGVYVTANEKELPENQYQAPENQATENQATENQAPENQTRSINQSFGSINQSFLSKSSQKNFESKVGSKEESEEAVPSDTLAEPSGTYPFDKNTQGIADLQALVPQPLAGKSADVALKLIDKFENYTSLNEYITFLWSVKKPQTLDFDKICFTEKFQEDSLRHYHNWEKKKKENDPFGLNHNFIVPNPNRI